MARGEQPFVRRPSGAGRLDARHVAPTRAGGVVRSGRLPARVRRRRLGRILLDEGPPCRSTRRNRSRSARSTSSERIRGARASGSDARSPSAGSRRSRNAGSRWGCSTSTAPTTRRSACTGRSASPRTASTARTESPFLRPSDERHPPLAVRRDPERDRGAPRQLGRTQLPGGSALGRALRGQRAARRYHDASARTARTRLDDAPCP